MTTGPSTTYFHISKHTNLRNKLGFKLMTGKVSGKIASIRERNKMEG
jgi:hypothetical protein